MRVILFGGSGMVGQGVLRECLLASDVDEVLAIGRKPLDARPGEVPEANFKKLRELTPARLDELSPHESELKNYDACFFCLGVSAAGMSEADYSRLTYELTLAIAKLLVTTSPQMTFIYVSGEGTDSSEKGSAMWARVKGKTENDLLKLPFKSALMFRPGAIVALHGIRSKTRAYRIAYFFIGWALPLAFKMWPNSVSTTELIGRAMLNAARKPPAEKILRTHDINELGALRSG